MQEYAAKIINTRKLSTRGRYDVLLNVLQLRCSLLLHFVVFLKTLILAFIGALLPPGRLLKLIPSWNWKLI